jgi:hypothetical protein
MFEPQFSQQRESLVNQLKKLLDRFSNAEPTEKAQILKQATYLKDAITICNWMNELDVEIYLSKSEWGMAKVSALRPLLDLAMRSALELVIYLTSASQSKVEFDKQKHHKLCLQLAQAGANYKDTLVGRTYSHSTTNHDVGVVEGEVVDETDTKSPNGKPDNQEDSFEKIAEDLLKAKSFEEMMRMMF